MEREPFSPPEKRTTAVRIDFPTASEILVSFPDQWTLIRTIRQNDFPLYVAALPPSKERPMRDHFYGLSAEINLSLDTYRMVKLFQPWPTPVLPVSWDDEKGEGRIERGGRLEIRLLPAGQAQMWTGAHYGVLWECFLKESRKRDGGSQQRLAQFWQAVEEEMKVAQIFTLPQDPAHPRGYQEFLAEMGYGPDPQFPQWWSKSRKPAGE